MLLQPRKFKFKNRHKRRRFLYTKTSKLIYGQAGLKILQPLWISNKQVFRYKLFLKKAARRSDKTSRKVWFNAFPHLPLSRKVSGSRMGKGKGKLAGWVAQLPAGVMLFEFKNLRVGRARYYSNQIAFRLPIKSRFVSNSQLTISTILNPSVKFSHQVYW